MRKLASGEGNLSLALTDKNVFVRMGDKHLSSNLIDGQFPDYRRVIPDAQKYKALVDRKPLEDALRRVSLLVEEKSRKVVFSFADGRAHHRRRRRASSAWPPRSWPATTRGPRCPSP